jgi:hypothetical protein
MEMVKFSLLAVLCASQLCAAGFSITVGNPVAANVPRMKTAGLAVRLENCADLSKSSLDGTAEGLVAGMRKSVPLQLAAGSTPGVYAINNNWPTEGVWVVDLKATCGAAKAGAIVPFRGAVYLRESIKLFPRFGAAAEVNASLTELAGGLK